MTGNLNASTTRQYMDMGYPYGDATGALLAVRGADYANNPGGFELFARNSDVTKSLIGHTDGSLLWAGRHIVRSVNGTVAGTDGNVALSINANSVSGLATVATTGAYSDLSGRPSLATVATSGSYNDLSNKPTISTGTVTQRFKETFNIRNGSVSKSITGLTAYKPVFIVFKSNWKCSIRLSSGFVFNDDNTYSLTIRPTTDNNTTQWIACVPNGTSISIIVYYDDEATYASFSIAVYQ